MSNAALNGLVNGIVSGDVEVIDLTRTLEPSTPTLPLPKDMGWGDSWPFDMEEISHYDDRGPAWYWNNFKCGEHTGTHFDAPVHWVTGKDYSNHCTDTIAAEKFIAPAYVIDAVAETEKNADFLMSVEFIEAWEKEHSKIKAGSWLLYRTDWSKKTNNDEFLNLKEDGCHTPGWTPETVKFLSEQRNVIGVGVETVGTDAGQAAGQEPMFPCHNIMHGANKFGLASLCNLDKLPAVGSVIIAAPLKIKNGSGSPLRVIALAPRQWRTKSAAKD